MVSTRLSSHPKTYDLYLLTKEKGIRLKKQCRKKPYLRKRRTCIQIATGILGYFDGFENRLVKNPEWNRITNIRQPSK